MPEKQNTAPATAAQPEQREEFCQFYDLEGYLFGTVHDRFAEHKALSAFDFFCIVIWKAERAKSYIAKKLLKAGKAGGTLEQAVRSLTHEIAEQDSAKKRLRCLWKWDFDLPMATAILTVFYPNEFTVYDSRVCDTLGGFHKMKNLTAFDRVWEQYELFVQAVRDAAPADLTLRHKDRYLWGKSFCEQLKDGICRNFVDSTEDTETDQTMREKAER